MSSSFLIRRLIAENDECGDDTMTKYKCMICGHIYDPAKGEPGQGIEVGTLFTDLPDDWTCPICGAVKAKFNQVG